MGGLSLTGYVLEPPRVGQSNSAFTSTPNVFISDQAAFDTAYPTAETAPRTDYHVFVLTDGDFPDATFCWTKNEVISRFDYDGLDQRFRTIPGLALVVVGTLALTSNTLRLSVTPPLSTDTSSYPIRLSIGIDSGTAFTTVVVADNGSFGSPPVGTVEVSQTTGNLNWNPADLANFAGQSVRFQRQTFYTLDESDGNVGVIDDVLLLNPKPATGQFPLIRIGFSDFLTPIEKATEAGFSPDPVAGTVEWALDTGRLKFNSGDIAANTDRAIYYDGVVFVFGTTVPTTAVGTVAAPGALWPLPPENSDTFFRVPGTVQFVETVFVDTLSVFPLSFGKKNRVEVRRSDGQVNFSFADVITYGSLSVEAVTADLTIERGIKLRMFRTPVDLDARDSTLKDVSAFYASVDATLADPIIASPTVNLPAVPVDTEMITINITQGTGTFTGVLPRLDVASPPDGFGYVLDSAERQFNFARRQSDVVTAGSVRKPYSSVQTSDPLLFSSGLVLELEDSPGSGTFTPLVLDDEVTVDLTVGLATLTVTEGTLLASGSTGSFVGTTTFTDATKDFTALGALQGDTLIIPSGPAAGVYTINTVGTATLTTDLAGAAATNIQYEIRRDPEILVDRFFKEIPSVDPNTTVERINALGTTANSPRLSVDLDFKDVVRFRFGKTTFSTAATQVINDGAFTAPASLPQGEVELSLTTGNLNFSQLDVDAGLTAYWVRLLTLGVDFDLQPPLGTIQFTERLLRSEEVHLNYTVLDEDGERVAVEERGAFEVRKELTADHIDPTSTLFFNPLGREVAANPSPQAFRGGRPQTTAKTTFDLSSSVTSVTFLPDDQITDALPSGATVGPSENVYVDYHVHEAIGGEKTLTALQAPMVGVTINIEDEETSFTLESDRTAEFPANHLLRIDGEEIYLLATPTYDSSTNLTTVSLAPLQEFQSDYRDPVLKVTSGKTRATPGFPFSSYFVTEVNPYETTARGSTRFRIFGDVSRQYTPGTVVLFTDGSSFNDFNYVEGSTFDADSNKTEVVFSSKGIRQYTQGITTAKRSVRPILESATATVITSRNPILDLPFTVFRRVEGEIGSVLLNQPDDFDILVSGQVSFAEPLKDNEALSIVYTGTRTIEDGRDFRASYTHLIAPNASNGILSQRLKIDYTAYLPDTVYWRVETFTNFRGELAEQYGDDAKAGAPTGGPVLENASGTPLFEQGSESLFFQEGRLANEDLVARPTLQFFNDGINYLEDVLQYMDGRVVGDHDGRFLFDGLITNPVRATFADTTNHIDDILKVADPPIVITFPNPPFLTFVGTFQEVYKPAVFSRFFPTRRALFGVSIDPTGLETGDTIADLGTKNLSKVSRLSRRLPWAIVTEPATIGATTITVDSTDAKENLLRPAFHVSPYIFMKVAIQDQDGTFLVPDLVGLTITGKTATTLTLSGPLLVNVPAGATVRHVFIDLAPPPVLIAFYLKSYRVNFDIGVDLQGGTLTHVEPFPPFDGSFPGVPVEMEITNPAAGEVLDASVFANSTITDPDRPAVFDGGTTDDDGNRQFPLLTPSSESEDGLNVDGLNIGYLAQEQVLIESGGGLETDTTASYEGIGSLNVARDRITVDVGIFPAPVPRVNDLVRILSGANAGLSYRRVTATNSTTWVEVAGGDVWPTQEAAISFTVTVSTSLAVGAASGTILPLTRLTDGGANFVAANVRPGHTVVVESGLNVGVRRQVTAVASATELDVVAFPFADAALSYRVDDALSTFGGAGSLTARLEAALDGQLAVLSTNTPPTKPNNERDALEAFFDHVFADVLTSGTGSTTTLLPTLTDLSVDYIAAGVNVTTDFVFVRSGLNAGVFKIDPAVPVTATTLDIEGSFPDTAAGLSYRIVTPESMTKEGLADIFTVLEGVDTAIVNATAFGTLVATAISVLGDAGAFARGLVTSDLVARATQVAARITDIEDLGAGSPAKLSAVMSSGDRLYDRRFVWIDARINRETGILVKKDRAVECRVKQEAVILKSLTKLLTTRTT